MRISYFLIVLLLLFTISCEFFENSDSNEEIDIEFSAIHENYVWGDIIDITVTTDDNDDVERVRIYINNELMINDMYEPFTYQWVTESYDFSQHTVTAKIFFDDGTEDLKTENVYLLPAMITDLDLLKIKDITETDSEGNLIGNIDNDDWFNGYYETFGPAFPNPVESICSIPFYITESANITIYILNDDFEFEEVLLHNTEIPIGSHIITWVAPQDADGLFRCVFHIDEQRHWYGDIQVGN